MSRYCNSEEVEQSRLVSLVRFWEKAHPELQWLFHIPNGGWRHLVTAVKMKLLGVRPGVPDLFLPVPNRGHHGLWVEMKSKRGKLTDNQKRWLKALGAMGYKTSVCFSAEEALHTIWEYCGWDAQELERSVKHYDRKVTNA